MTNASDARIAALEAELAAVRAEMQEFTYSVSHDLRAPLRHIVSYARLVQEEAAPQLSVEVQGFLSTIADSARHMGVLLDGLTDYSRIGSVAMTPGVVSLQELVQEVCDECTRRQPHRSLDWRIATGLPVVLVDPGLLRQALRQVLGNAVKFTGPRAQAQIQVSAQPGPGDRFVTLLVRDNGVGYNPQLQSSLFRALGRLHSAKQFEGIGMGLVLARRILERLGGSLTITGVIDGGCCVTMVLPTCVITA